MIEKRRQNKRDFEIGIRNSLQAHRGPPSDYRLVWTPSAGSARARGVSRGLTAGPE